MNKLILCEGKADAILISYYLERTCGWSHRNKRNPNSIIIKTDEAKNEYGYWYRKGDDQLLICGVGRIQEYLMNVSAS